MLRLLLWLIIALAQLGPSRGQQLNQTVISPNQTGITTPTQETVEDVRAKIESLKQPLPEKETLLVRELDRIDNEIALASAQRAIVNGYRGLKTYLDKSLDQLSRQSKVLASMDCGDANTWKYRDAVQIYLRQYNALTIQYPYPLEYEKIEVPQAGSAVSETVACKQTKEKFSSSDYSNPFKEISDSLQKSVGDFETDQARLADEYGKYLNALSQRRTSVQEKLNTSQSAYQIGSNLWLLLLILGAACVATILGIKLFSVEIQMEWVASGQVIQFVTVMILLSVILALGLSGILKENTLGTLLGGVAGYVLAQGVGRAAARDVARLSTIQRAPTASSSAASVPPTGGTGAT